MRTALDQALSTVATFVPRLAMFLLILIIGILLAKVIAKAVEKVLERVGFDDAVERGGIRRALAASEYDASDVVAKIAYYAMFLFVLQLAFGVFGPNPISDLLTEVIAFLPRLLVAIVIVVITAAIAAGAKTLIQGTLGGLSYGRVLANIVSIFILGLGVIAALNQVGIATTVTTPVLITVLATAGGIAVIGVGGGLIAPMAKRWEGWLARAEQESGTIREQVKNAPGVTEQARAAKARHSDPANEPPADPVGLDVTWEQADPYAGQGRARGAGPR